MSVSFATEKLKAGIRPPRSTRRSRPDRPRSSPGLNRPEGWVDGRTREGRYIREYQEMLADHHGGPPTVSQAELIRRASRTALRLELLDARMLAGELSKDQASREYVALNTGLIRILRELGMSKAPAEQSSLAGYLAAKAGA
jgi:hypothetical protein